MVELVNALRWCLAVCHLQNLSLKSADPSLENGSRADLKFNASSRMKPRWLLFALTLPTDDVIFVQYTVPTIVMSRQCDQTPRVSSSYCWQSQRSTNHYKHHCMQQRHLMHLASRVKELCGSTLLHGIKAPVSCSPISLPDQCNVHLGGVVISMQSP